MKKVYIETYGCSNNQAESQMMAGILNKDGFALVDNERDADVIVVNTCSVKSGTSSSEQHRLKQLEKTGKKLIVAGCLSEAEPHTIEKIAPTASLLGTHHLDKITEVAHSESRLQLLGKTKMQKVGIPKIRTNQVVDIVAISSGCLSRCTFCSTKLAKGDLFSFDENKIIEEISDAKRAGGAREFWLTSQDCGCYGFDAKTNAAKLLKNITHKVSGVYFLRMGMANPQHIKLFLSELIEAYKDEHVFKFLHIPVQSGSPSVLRKMARGHTSEDFVKVVEEFRKAIPEITIWTDIIAGFPGETEEDFSQTIALIEETKPDFVNISSYGSRPGTASAKLKQLSTQAVKERTRKLSELCSQISLDQNKRWIGWSGPILIDEYNPQKQNFIGRNYCYKPVALRGNYEMGQLVSVNITGAEKTCLIGR